MERRTLYSNASEGSAIEINKVLRNTYMLLALTLGFSAVKCRHGWILGNVYWCSYIYDYCK
jgi:FtsH-binding integral membrane protein